MNGWLALLPHPPRNIRLAIPKITGPLISTVLLFILNSPFTSHLSDANATPMVSSPFTCL